MEEGKRTFGEFVKANKEKIIKGAIIVVGVAAGIVAIKLLSSHYGREVLETVENCNAGELTTEGLTAIGDVASNV